MNRAFVRVELYYVYWKVQALFTLGASRRGHRRPGKRCWLKGLFVEKLICFGFVGWRLGWMRKSIKNQSHFFPKLIKRRSQSDQKLIREAPRSRKLKEVAHIWRGNGLDPSLVFGIKSLPKTSQNRLQMDVKLMNNRIKTKWKTRSRFWLGLEPIVVCFWNSNQPSWDRNWEWM